MKQDTATNDTQKTVANTDNTTNGATKNKQANDTSANNKQEDSLFEKFFIDQLQDIYYAENQIVKALPKMEQASTTEELKEAFNDHRHQTEKHIKRLEKVFNLLGKKAEGKKCEAIEGIIKECDNIIKETKEGTMTRDAALVMAAQKVEHYEIATYGGLVQFAITMGKNNIADILDETLMEEEDTDNNLTDIAEAFINIEAEEETKFSWNQHQMQETTV